MYYRFYLEKGGKTAGLFHPLDEWCVPKEKLDGIVDEDDFQVWCLTQ